MQESVIYQDIKAEGIQEGIQQGIQEGIQKEHQWVLRLLSRKVGDIAEDYDAQVKDLPLLKLEALGEALLDFEQIDDLAEWLAAHANDHREAE
ncbi:MAG: DUF4351 domain-containing protein, partial [Cyanobacteria bacterium P01_D01_bin.44]